MKDAKQLDPIAAGIKLIISQKGFRQKAIAKRAGFTEQQFSDMLNDRKIIKAIDLTSIAEALEVEISDIYAAGQKKVV